MYIRIYILYRVLLQNMLLNEQLLEQKNGIFLPPTIMFKFNADWHINVRSLITKHGKMRYFEYHDFDLIYVETIVRFVGTPCNEPPNNL